MKIRALLLRLAALTVLVGLMLAACFSDRAASGDLTGLWESTYRGRGGEANSFWIHADSVIDRYYIKAFDFHFSAGGDSLHIRPILPESLLAALEEPPPAISMHYAIVGDTLVRREAQRTEWLVRQGPPPANPYSIIGSWKAVRSTDAFTVTAYHRYRPDSVLEIRLPVAVKHGVYELQPDSLWFFFADGETSRCSLSVRGDSLELKRDYVNGAFTFGYVRVARDAWYTLEEY